MRKLLLLLTAVLSITILPLSSSFAKDELLVTDYETRVGVGCYGRCGYLDVTFKVKNIAYEKGVSILYKGDDGEWHELPAYYSKPLEDGYEEWRISTNFSERGKHIEFVGKYEVNGQVFWDNNDYNNFIGNFL